MTPTNPRSTARNNISKRRFSNNVPPGLHYLPPLNPKSDEFLELFRSFLSSKDERTNILALSDEDAKLFIEIIDRAFRAERLEPELRQLAFSVLRRLCGKTGHLPESYLLSHKFDLSGLPRASGGFADVRVGVLKGKSVAVKSLRIAEQDDKARIRKRFCKEVVMWKNLSHPNVLNLIGVPDTLEDGRFSMVSIWMANGNIMEYVRDNAGNHLKLLADSVEGLRYLHNANIIHGDLKGANILIANTNPVTACLADFGFMTIVYDPSLNMSSSTNTHEFGGTTPFMPPEHLVPPRFGLDRCTPSKAADIYAMGMVVYQVLTGTPPFGKLSTSEVVFKVLEGGKPPKPENALELGLSDGVWKLLEDCWQTDRTLRPQVTDVLGRVKAAASACGILPSVKNVPKRFEDPESRLDKFDGLFSNTPFDDEDHAESYPQNPLTSAPLVVGGPSTMDRRRPSQESTLTDSSTSGSFFSKISAADSATTTAETSTDALIWSNRMKGGDTDALTNILFGPGSDPPPHPVTTVDPVSRSSTPGSECTARPPFIRGDSSPYRTGKFAGSNRSSRTVLTYVTPQRDQPRSDTDPATTASTVMPHDRDVYAEKSSVGNLVASTFLLLPDTAAIATAQSRDDATHQLRRPTSMVQLDGNGKHKPRTSSRFRVRERLGRVFDPILHSTGDAHK